MRFSKTWATTNVRENFVWLVSFLALFLMALSLLRLDSTLAFPWKLHPLTNPVLKMENGVELWLDPQRPLAATATQLRVPVIFSQLDSLYQAKTLADRLHGVTTEPLLYVGENEASRTVPATLTLPLSSHGVGGNYEASVLGDQKFVFSVLPTSDWVPSLTPAHLRGIVLGLIFLALLAARKKSPLGLLALLVVTLAFEFPGASFSFPLAAAGGLVALGFSLFGETSVPFPAGRETRATNADTFVVLAFIAVTLGLFAYYLLLSADFRWSIFEERDFLLARKLWRLEEFPVLGPQLLAGGQIPGGGIYYLLAPLLAFKNDPTVFSLFTKFSFLASAALLAFTLWRFVGPVGTVIGTLLFCGSSTVMALAYWPIHPNLSLFPSLLFLFCSLHFFVEKRASFAIWAALVLSFLIQWHITFALLLPPFAALICVSEEKRKAKLLTQAILVFLLPFLPYLWHELVTGFANTRLFLAHPRYQPLYVPHRPLMVHYTGDLLRTWLSGGSAVWTWFGLAFVDIGLVFCAAYSRERLPKVLALLFVVPFLSLSLIGMGYGSRHFIALAAVTFLVVAYGAEQLARTLRPVLSRGLAIALALFLLVTYAQLVTDRPRALAVSAKEGEWAVSFEAREKVAEFLITELGVSQAQYENQTYWYWLGWSMDPEIYAGLRQTFAARALPERRLQANQTLFLLSDPDRPLFVSAYDLKNLGTVSGITVYEGTPKGNRITTANTFNRARLSNAEAELENAQFPDGITALSHRSWVISLLRDRLKFLVSLEISETDGKFDVHWALASPHFSGYYQEIKTLWKPTLIATRRTGNLNREFPVAEVLGSLIEKTPREGKFTLEGSPKEWSFSVRTSGFFDQSSMSEPILSPRVFVLNPPTASERKSFKVGLTL